jgi:hypothetical protein
MNGQILASSPGGTFAFQTSISESEEILLNPILIQRSKLAGQEKKT